MSQNTIKTMQTMTLARAIDLINEQERRIAELEAECSDLRIGLKFREKQLAATHTAGVPRGTNPAADQITPWLETEEGKAAVAKAVADANASVAELDAARAFDPSAKYSAAVPAALTTRHAIYDVLYEMRLAPRHQLEEAARRVEQHLLASGQGAKDSERLDWLEQMANEPGGLLLHDGGDFTGRAGLGLRRIGRTIRQAIDAAMPANGTNGEGR